MRGTGVIGRPASISFVGRLRINVSFGKRIKIKIEFENRGPSPSVSEHTREPRMDGGNTDVVRCDEGVQSAHEAQYTVL